MLIRENTQREIYRNVYEMCYGMSMGLGIGVGLIFVPDPNHEWEPNYLEEGE